MIGFKAELMGRTNTAIHTARSPGAVKVSSKVDLSPMTIIGIQHKRSVKTMHNTRLASAVSLLVLADWDLAWISLSVP